MQFYFDSYNCRVFSTSGQYSVLIHLLLIMLSNKMLNDSSKHNTFCLQKCMIYPSFSLLFMTHQ
jgi:hypothetical protein